MFGYSKEGGYKGSENSIFHLDHEKEVQWKIRARLNARVFKKVDGVHYDSNSISSPVTNDVIVRIVVVLSFIFGWAAKLIDVQGEFSRCTLLQLSKS
jgi:hypothetical protein